MSADELNLAAAWAPDVCTLPITERPLRVSEFDELLSSAVLRVDRPEPGRLELELNPTAEVAAGVATLAVHETACCSFFTFILAVMQERLLLAVAVPPAHIAVLDALAARVSMAVSGSDHHRRS